MAGIANGHPPARLKECDDDCRRENAQPRKSGELPVEQPHELGLKDEDAAKLREIHQLRPLVTGQPWGIFFLSFENKAMSVTVLRRILRKLVVTKRGAAKDADRAAQLRRSRRTAWWVASAGWSCAVASAVALLVLMVIPTMLYSHYQAKAEGSK